MQHTLQDVPHTIGCAIVPHTIGYNMATVIGGGKARPPCKHPPLQTPHSAIFQVYYCRTIAIFSYFYFMAYPFQTPLSAIFQPHYYHNIATAVPHQCYIIATVLLQWCHNATVPQCYSQSTTVVPQYCYSITTVQKGGYTKKGQSTVQMIVRLN